MGRPRHAGRAEPPGPASARWPFFLLLAYRSEDLPDNEALGALLHGLNRSHAQAQLRLDRFNRVQVQEFVQLHLGPEAEAGSRLGALLFDTTNGNPLFVTETLRDLEERWHAGGDCARWPNWPPRMAMPCAVRSSCAATTACRRSSLSGSAACRRTRTQF